MDGQLCDSLLLQTAYDYGDALQFTNQSYEYRKFEKSVQKIREITNSQLEVDIHKIQRQYLDKLVDALLSIEAHELMVSEMLVKEQELNKRLKDE